MSSQPSGRSTNSKLVSSAQILGTKRKLPLPFDRNIRNADSESANNSEVELPATKRVKVSTSIGGYEQCSGDLDLEDDDECEEEKGLPAGDCIGEDYTEADEPADTTTDEVYSGDAAEGESEMVTPIDIDSSRNKENVNMTVNHVKLVHPAPSSDVEVRGEEENDDSSKNQKIPTLEPSIAPSEERFPDDSDRHYNGIEDPDEMELLEETSLESAGRSDTHDVCTAPILTRIAYTTAGYSQHESQYGVLGRVISINSNSTSEVPEDPRLYINTNTPFSAVICGVQGSGKSHTVSVLLESMLIPNLPHIGSLKKPLAGLVLHFGEGGPSSLPSEAAWIGVSKLNKVETPKVCVYVSRSSLNTMKRVYKPLGDKIEVKPLLFSQSELDAEAFLSMMSVGSSESAPLYVQIILSILRDLGESYSFEAFKQMLDTKRKSFNPAQISGLEQRMALLTSFMEPQTSITSKTTGSRFSGGQLTIIDLSDPFIDAASANGLFETLIRLFIRTDVGTGKVLLVDEAHKYLSTGRGSSGLTKSLLTLTREQRHLAMRVLISTQEPTVLPSVLLDLCTVTILHRFTSPSWWDHIAHHVSADLTSESASNKVVGLQVCDLSSLEKSICRYSLPILPCLLTGQAIVLAPSGLASATANTETDTPTLHYFGRRYVLMKTRKRVTVNGGASLLALNA